MNTATRQTDVREIARHRLAELERARRATVADVPAHEQRAPRAPGHVVSLDAARLRRCLLNNAERAGLAGVRAPALVRLARDLVPGCSAEAAHEAIDALRREGRLEYRTGDRVAITGRHDASKAGA